MSFSVFCLVSCCSISVSFFYYYYYVDLQFYYLYCFEWVQFQEILSVSSFMILVRLGLFFYTMFGFKFSWNLLFILCVFNFWYDLSGVSSMLMPISEAFVSQFCHWSASMERLCSLAHSSVLRLHPLDFCRLYQSIGFKQYKTLYESSLWSAFLSFLFMLQKSLKLLL